MKGRQTYRGEHGTAWLHSHRGAHREYVAAHATNAECGNDQHGYREDGTRLGKNPGSSEP